MQKVGNEGVITVEEAKGLDSEMHEMLRASQLGAYSHAL